MDKFIKIMIHLITFMPNGNVQIYEHDNSHYSNQKRDIFAPIHSLKALNTIISQQGLSWG